MERAFQDLQEFINSALANIDSIELLDAGCGSATYLSFSPRTYMTGIDISRKQLDQNDKLDRKILGDIQHIALPTEQYDVIICWNVLEHIQNPTLALENFYKAIKPGGLVIISIPNLYSLKGLITKFTPHWFHVFVYRYIYGIKNAGKEDVSPFKTYLRKSMSPGALKNFARNKNLEISYYSTYDFHGNFRLQNYILGKFYRMLDSFVRLITFNKIGDSEFFIVFKKPFNQVL